MPGLKPVPPVLCWGMRLTDSATFHRPCRFRRTILVVSALSVMLTGCAVIPKDISQRAVSGMAFADLIRAADRFSGRTIVCGGYVVSVANFPDRTEIVAIQAPLGMRQAPKSKDLTQGRMVVTVSGFLDPQVYSVDRRITVGGTITGGSAAGGPDRGYPYLAVTAEAIHLWADPEPVPNDPWWYGPGWYGPGWYGPGWYGPGWPYHDPWRYPYYRRHRRP